MEVGTLEISLVIRGAHSLKEKRRVVKSLKDQLKSRFAVAVAEVDHQDSWQRAIIGVAIVGSDAHVLVSVLAKIADHARRFRGAEVVDAHIEIR